MSELTDELEKLHSIYSNAMNREDITEKTRQDWTKMARILSDARSELIRLYSLTEALPPDLGDVHSLPKALRDQLTATKTDELENQLVTVINALGGTANLDQILVGLFRKFELVQERRFIQNKLYRMTKNDLVWSVPKKKGVYTTEPIVDVATTSDDEGIVIDFDNTEEEDWDTILD